MKINEFNKFLRRDNHRCWHCGIEGDTLVPQHRYGRSMGGKNAKAAQVANVIVFCSYANGLAESDHNFANYCRLKGWKLESWHDPEQVAVYDFQSGVWFRLDNSYGRVPVSRPELDFTEK